MDTTAKPQADDIPPLLLPGTTVGGQVGIFSMPITVYNPNRTERRHLDGVVDTGALHSVIPARILEALDIPEYVERPYQMADGATIAVSLGSAQIELLGEIAAVPVLFGPDARTVLIGATTLETFGYAADPRHQRLIPATLTI